ncbi:MAG: hypothetical protein GX774_04375 [Armatimonadetes bacterium]|jgi:hypothetical protein|nr:hypothetical protein [Armatimonadota bacterium]
MFGGMIRGLILAMLVLMGAVLTLTLMKAAVAVLISLVVFIAPFVFLYWLLSHLPLWGSHRHAPRPVPTPWRGRRWAPRPRWQPRPEEEATRWVRQADHLAKEIARLVRRCDRNTRDALAGSPASARKLAERVRALARLCQTLDAHLRGNQAMEYRRQAEEMVRRATLAADAFAADQYRAAAQSLESQAAVCEELARTRERLHAEVARILAALSNLRSRIVSMLASPTAAIGQIDRTADELADLEAQVDTFQDSVRQVLQQASH